MEGERLRSAGRRERSCLLVPTKRRLSSRVRATLRKGTPWALNGGALQVPTRCRGGNRGASLQTTLQSTNLRREPSRLFLNTSNSIPAGTAIQIRVTYQDGIFTANGKVARSEPAMGIGISFNDVKKDQQATLQRWLVELGRSSKHRRQARWTERRTRIEGRRLALHAIIGRFLCFAPASGFNERNSLLSFQISSSIRASSISDPTKNPTVEINQIPAVVCACGCRCWALITPTNLPRHNTGTERKAS